MQIFSLNNVFIQSGQKNNVRTFFGIFKVNYIIELNIVILNNIPAIVRDFVCLLAPFQPHQRFFSRQKLSHVLSKPLVYLCTKLDEKGYSGLGVKALLSHLNYIKCMRTNYLVLLTDKPQHVRL